MANDQFGNGPYLNAALLCERAIQESDGVLSLVRVIDKVTAVREPGMATGVEGFPPFLVSLSLVIVLRAGDASGSYELNIRPREPDGTELPPSMVPITFSGTDTGQGVNVILNISLGIRHQGLYWFDVQLDGQVISRLPLRIEYQQAEDRPLPDPSARGTGE